MIYTVTLNPAIDHIVSLPTFSAGTLNRACSETFCFGGKGVNVSLVLKELDVPSVALGFVAGFTGEMLENGVKAKGITTDFVRTVGETRVNTKISTDNGEETEVNGVGPTVSEADFQKLLCKVKTLDSGDVLVLSGSLSPGLSPDAYARLAAACKPGVRVVADTSGAPLKAVLSARPWLVKPNEAELRELCGVGEVFFLAKKAQERGAQNVLCSRGKNGALLLCEDGSGFDFAAPPGTVQSTVGAGDALLAGFLAAIERGERLDDAVIAGVAAGSATAFSVGLAHKKEIDAVLAKMPCGGR